MRLDKKLNQRIYLKTFKIVAALTLCTFYLSADGALYSKCVACHGANGEKTAMGKSKVIKNMSKADIVKALKGYKNGTYGGPMKGVMASQVANLNDAQIESLATYIKK